MAITWLHPQCGRFPCLPAGRCTPAARIFTLADEGKIQIYISALSLTNVHYLISKQKAAEEAKEILKKFKVLVHLVPLTGKIVDLALNSALRILKMRSNISPRHKMILKSC